MIKNEKLRFIKFLEPVSGEGANGAWLKQDVIFESIGEYPKRVCITFWNEKVNEVKPLGQGEVVQVSANVESREHNGRWYTELRGWRVQRAAASETEYRGYVPPDERNNPNYRPPAPVNNPAVMENDLPF